MLSWVIVDVGTSIDTELLFATVPFASVPHVIALRAYAGVPPVSSVPVSASVGSLLYNARYSVAGAVYAAALITCLNTLLSK